MERAAAHAVFTRAGISVTVAHMMKSIILGKTVGIQAKHTVFRTACGGGDPATVLDLLHAQVL